MTQWLVEEAVTEAVELADRLKGSMGGGNGGVTPEAVSVSPHESLGHSHAEAMMRAKAGG